MLETLQLHLREAGGVSASASLHKLWSVEGYESLAGLSPYNVRFFYVADAAW